MKNKTLSISYFIGIGIFISLIVSSLYIFKPTFAVWVDNKIYDIYLRSDKKSELSNSVVIVDIDENTLKKVGQWPWPRYLNATLLQNIVNSGAASVGFDILLSEQDRTSPKHIQENLKRYFDTTIEFEGLSKDFYDNDELFAKVLQQSPSVLGMYLNFDNKKDSLDESFPRGISVSVLSNETSKPISESLLIANYATTPIKELLNSSSVGYINALADNDGVVRKIPLLMGLKNSSNELKTYPNLSLATLLKAFNQDSIVVKTNEDGVQSLQVGIYAVPLEADGTFFVRYKGGKKVYKYISAVDIITNNFDKKELEGKVVFVGSSATGLLDIRINPFDTHYPGVEVHASIVDNILTNHFINVPSYTPGMQVVLIVFFGVVLSILFGKISTYFLLFIVAIFSMSFWYVGQYLFIQGIFISPLYIFLVIFLQTVFILFSKFIFESLEKSKIKQAFSRYVSPVVVSQIANSGIDVFKGEQKEVTILFTDIRGFTTLSEKLNPEDIVKLLNKYFTPMTAIIKQNQGTVDKFIGDSVMAFWNAPLDVENHQYLAIQTALKMQEELKELNKKLKKEFDVELSFGSGIHTGFVYVGNMGSAELLDYTIIGDSVNIASRVEGLCSVYGLNTIVSEQTILNCKDKYYYLIIDEIKVRGKSEAVKIYCPIDLEVAKQREKEFELFEKAYNLYVKGELNIAFDIFQKLCNDYLQKDTKNLYTIHLNRCKDNLNNS